MIKHALAAIAALSLVASASADDFISGLMNKYKTDWATAALLGTAAKDYSIDPKSLFDARSRHGLDADDVYTGALFSSRTRYNRDAIYKMRASGMGWGEIAHKIGMHPGDFNKMRKSWGKDDDVFNDIWRQKISGKISRDDEDWFRKQKMSDRDAWASLIYSREKGVTFRNAADWFKKNRTIGLGRGVVKTPGKPNPFTKGKDKPKDNDDKEKDKGKGKGKGKGGGL